MKNLNKIAAALALAGLGASGSAMAQMSNYDSSTLSGYNPSWYVTGDLIGMDPSGHWIDKNGPGAGIRFGKAISQDWDVQMGLTYSEADNNSERYQQDTVGVDALYMFSRNRFRPFLLVGVGDEYDKFTDPGISYRYSHGSPFVEAGFGAQYQLSDQWALQADLRDVHGFLYNGDAGFNHADNPRRCLSWQQPHHRRLPRRCRSHRRPRRALRNTRCPQLICLPLTARICRAHSQSLTRLRTL